MKPGRAAPRLLLSLRSLSGVSLATRDRMLEVVARYREPESLAVSLSKAVDAGAEGVLTSPTPALRAALAELKRMIPIYAVVPNLSEQERHELEPGIEAVIGRNGYHVGFGTRMKLGLGALVNPAALFRGNFTARLPRMIEVEALPIRRRSLRGVVLDAWLTDLALAAGHRKFFERFRRFVRGRYRVAAGLETHNLGLLLARLREWNVRPDFVLGPVNPCGLLMKPSAAEALAELVRSEIPVVAIELRAGGVNSLELGTRFAREHRTHGLAPDLAEMDDVGAELRALRQGA